MEFRISDYVTYTCIRMVLFYLSWRQTVSITIQYPNSIEIRSIIRVFHYYRVDVCGTLATVIDLYMSTIAAPTSMTVTATIVAYRTGFRVYLISRGETGDRLAPCSWSRILNTIGPVSQKKKPKKKIIQNVNFSFTGSIIMCRHRLNDIIF